MRTVTLVCPNCKSDQLATVEDLSGAALGGAAWVDGERVFDHDGWTEVFWDSSESKAVECRQCGWQQGAASDGPALDELMALCEECGDALVDPDHVGVDGRSVCDECREVL